jgi:hypothetical protein
MLKVLTADAGSEFAIARSWDTASPKLLDNLNPVQNEPC